MSARIRRISTSHRPVFLVNSRLGLFSAAHSWALLLPKLRSHFAEFLNKGSPARLRILSSPTCVGLRYGRLRFVAAFLASVKSCYEAKQLTDRNRSPSQPSLTLCVLHYTTASLLGRGLPSPRSAYPSVSLHPVARRYRNINRLSIAYDYCPRLRSRLTLRGRAFLRKP